MRVNCLIIEDEIAGQTILSKKLQSFFPECQIDAIIESKDEAIHYLSNHTVDLVFLDVHLKGGLGLDVLNSVEINFETIFITAHKEYAIEALNSGADYYLLKPIQDQEFKKGMALVLGRIKQKKTVSSISIQHLNNPVTIHVEDIIYFKSEGAYSHIITETENYFSSKNIGHYEHLLSEEFIRTHHSYLVNKSKFTKVIKGRGGKLIMSNGTEIPIAQRKMNDFLNFFQNKD